MSNAAIIAGFFVFLAFVGMIFFFYFKFRKTDNEAPNLPTVMNFVPQLTEGFTMGVEIDCVKCLNGNYKIKFLPKNIYKDWKHNKILKEPRVQKIVIGKGKRLVTMSSGNPRPVVMYFPDKAIDMDEEIKNSPFGMYIAQAVELINENLNADFSRSITNEQIIKIYETLPVIATDLATRMPEELIKRSAELSRKDDVEEKKKPGFSDRGRIG